MINGAMKSIILTYDQNLATCQTTMFQVDFALENAGVRGSQFFLFSYKFLGTVSFFRMSQLPKYSLNKIILVQGTFKKY